MIALIIIIHVIQFEIKSNMINLFMNIISKWVTFIFRSSKHYALSLIFKYKN